MCDQGPALLVNDRVFTRVTPEKVAEILDDCRTIFGVPTKSARTSSPCRNQLTYATHEPKPA